MLGLFHWTYRKHLITIPYALLLAKLEAYGPGNSACALLKDYHSGRLQKVTIGDVTSEWAAVSRGVPQGSVLGLLIFIIYINYYITEVKLHAYAGDEQLYH